MPKLTSTASLDELLSKHTRPDAPVEARLPGVAFTLNSREGQIYSKASGNLTTHSINSVFSVSKMVTPICVLKAVEEGLFSLDDALQPLLPDLNLNQVLTGFSEDGKPQFEDVQAPITLRNALSHTSG
jgi:CubicO group peptidase (beta-lactamase class C family)